MFIKVLNSICIYYNMHITMSLVFLVTVLFEYVLIATAAIQSRTPQPTVAYSSPMNHRPSDTFRENDNIQTLDLSPDLKNTDRKLFSDQYRTLQTDALVDDLPVDTKIDIHPILTSDSPIFITRSKYVSNPYLYDGRRHRDSQKMVIVNDQRSEYMANNENTLPKWNRYCPGRRQLKSNDPPPMHDGDGRGYAGYDNYGFDYGEGVDYDEETSGGNPKSYGRGDDGAVGWYSEHPANASRPASVVSRPGRKIAVDVNGLTALVKIGLTKLKTFKVWKFLLILAVKLKLFTLFKLFLFAKFAALGKIVKLFLLPAASAYLSWYTNALISNFITSSGANTNVIDYANSSISSISVVGSSSSGEVSSGDFQNRMPARNRSALESVWTKR